MSEDQTQDGRLRDDDTGDWAAVLEQAAAGQPHVQYVLTLYVAGLRPRSQARSKTSAGCARSTWRDAMSCRSLTSTSSPRSLKARKSSPPRRW